MKAKNIILISFLLMAVACSKESDTEIQPVLSLEELSDDHIELESVETPKEVFSEGGRIGGLTYFDDSGLIEFRVYSETSGYAGSHTDRSATVGADFVCIGGGALIHDWTNNKGALLTASYPSSNKKSWLASSHDHAVADHHKLTVYAIGMKINGVSESTLKSYIYHDDAPSMSSQYPFKQVNLPSGYELLSGGTKIDWVHPGNLSVSSRPIGSHAWYSQGKDHLYYCPTTITTYVVGILRNIPNFGTIDTNVYTAFTYTNGGYSNVAISLNNTGYVLTGVGGSAMSGEIGSNVGKGRMLYGLKPGSLGRVATAYSKDHLYYDDGTTTVYAIGLKKL